VSISTPKRDQKISECSTRRSENQAKACKENQIVSSLYPVKSSQIWKVFLVKIFCQNTEIMQILIVIHATKQIYLKEKNSITYQRSKYCEKYD
jgi:hypothetical protein